MIKMSPDTKLAARTMTRVAPPGGFLASCLVLTLSVLAWRSGALAQRVEFSVQGGSVVGVGLPAVDPRAPERVVVPHEILDPTEEFSSYELRTLAPGETTPRAWRVVVSLEQADALASGSAAAERQLATRTRQLSGVLRRLVPLEAASVSTVDDGEAFVRRAVLPTPEGEVTIVERDGELVVRLGDAAPLFRGELAPVQTANNPESCYITGVLASVYRFGHRLLLSFDGGCEEFCGCYQKAWAWLDLPGPAPAAPPPSPSAPARSVNRGSWRPQPPRAGVGLGIAWSAVNAHGMPALGLWFRTAGEEPVCARVLQLAGHPARHRLRFAAVDRCFATEREASRFLASALSSRTALEPRLIAHEERAERGTHGQIPIGDPPVGSLSYDSSAGTLELRMRMLLNGHQLATHGEVPSRRHRGVQVDLLGYQVEGVGVVVAVLGSCDAANHCAMSAAAGVAAER